MTSEPLSGTAQERTLRRVAKLLQRAFNAKSEAVDELVSAIDLVVGAWDGGDLAGAVNNARETADRYRESEEI